MVEFVAKLIARSVDGIVRRIVIPVTSAIPALVEHGVLLALFALLWAAFGIAALVNPAAIGDTWAAIGGLPLLVQGLAWLLFLPVMAGLWIASTDWAIAVRIVLIVGVAAWNLVVFIPRPQAGQPASSPSPAA